MRNEERAGETRSLSFTEKLTENFPYLRKKPGTFSVDISCPRLSHLIRIYKKTGSRKKRKNFRYIYERL